jgi:nicotinamide mononucleotide (NMN) deamidase PncC
LLKLLADELLEYAQARQQTIVTAESCSAGMLAFALANGEGASQTFQGGFVAYTKDMKSRVLGVPPSLLKEKTAVCGEVADAMAIGALLKSGASIASRVLPVLIPMRMTILWASSIAQWRERTVVTVTYASTAAGRRPRL